MNCPRDGTELIIEHHHDIEVDHCPSCNGRWLDHHELDELEATVPSTEEERRATIQFAKNQSELDCPKCGKRMTAFNYRAYDLELDTCEDEHGFWLDAGEEGRVRDIIEERIRGLNRAASAEAAWGGFLDGLKGGGRRRGGVRDSITGLFRRKR
ncbi:MAG: zf-TFIIB domain-containing protein [Chloroflexi bacterium]|nr:zf-TFIIB domain-containing protein [Chloroflexota bacterium]